MKNTEKPVYEEKHTGVKSMRHDADRIPPPAKYHANSGENRGFLNDKPKNIVCHASLPLDCGSAL